MGPVEETSVDLARLALSFGEGRRLEMEVPMAPLELGGQLYEPRPATVPVRLDVSRPSGGFAFRISFALHLEGPCMRCLAPASLDLEVEAREIDREDSEDEEMRSPYVEEDRLDLGAWAHDAAILALPAQLLCRPDCKGLCPTCGEPLNDADPEAHRHGAAVDPRWAALDALKDD